MTPLPPPFLYKLYKKTDEMEYDCVPYIIIGPDPESNGGDVEGVGDEVADVPHVAHVP